MRNNASTELFSEMLAESRKRKFKSREAATEYFPVCSRLLDDYETGKGFPSADVVLAMSETLEEPALRRAYCSMVCPIGRKLGHQTVAVEELPMVALRLIKELQDVTDRQRDFMEIICDGEVDDHEVQDFMKIAQEFCELKQAVESLEVWIEVGLHAKGGPKR